MSAAGMLCFCLKHQPCSCVLEKDLQICEMVHYCLYLPELFFHVTLKSLSLFDQQIRYLKLLVADNMSKSFFMVSVNILHFKRPVVPDSMMTFFFQKVYNTVCEANRSADIKSPC
jgi:hypothetical protein